MTTPGLWCETKTYKWPYNKPPEWARTPTTAEVASFTYDALELSRFERRRSFTFFRSQDGITRSYDIYCPKGQFVVRCTLSVDPHVRPYSEAATMRWIHDRTDIPVPPVLAFRDDRDGRLGYDWMIMCKMHGRPLAEVWGRLDWHQKRNIVLDVASWISQLHEWTNSRFGCIDFIPEVREVMDFPPNCRYQPTYTHNQSFHGFTISPLTLPTFNQCHWPYNSSGRGPFDSSVVWMHTLARLQQARLRAAIGPERFQDTLEFHQSKAREGLPNDPLSGNKDFAQLENGLFSETSHALWEDEAIYIRKIDKDVQERKRHHLELAVRLSKRIPEKYASKVREKGRPEYEDFHMHHGNISLNNILIDMDGEPIALLGWDHASFAPRFEAARYPAFLDQLDYNGPCPRKRDYMKSNTTNRVIGSISSLRNRKRNRKNYRADILK